MAKKLISSKKTNSDKKDKELGKFAVNWIPNSPASSIKRADMLKALRNKFKKTDWWKEYGFKSTKDIRDEDLIVFYEKFFGLRQIDIKEDPRIAHGDIDKLRSFNKNFVTSYEWGKEIFNIIRKNITEFTIYISLQKDKDYDHDNYTDKSIQNLNPVEFLVWLNNIVRKLEAKFKIVKDELDVLFYKGLKKIWENTGVYAINIAKNKIQYLLTQNNIDYNFLNTEIRNYKQFLSELKKLKNKFPEGYSKIENYINNKKNLNKGIKYLVYNPDDIFYSYIESFYTEPIKDLFSLKATLKISKKSTREKTLKLIPIFKMEGYAGAVGKLYEDLLDSVFKVKLGVIGVKDFTNLYNRLVKDSMFSDLSKLINVKNLYRFRKISNKRKERMEDLLKKPDIEKSMVKLHLFNVVSIILSHFKLSEKQIPLRMNMIQAIRSIKKTDNWIKTDFKGKNKIEDLTDDEIRNYYYKLLKIPIQDNPQQISKFVNVGNKVRTWAPVDYLLGGKPISLKRQKKLNVIKLKTGASISGESGKVAEEIRLLLEENYGIYGKNIRLPKLQIEILSAFKDVLFRNNHYLVVTTDKQVAIFDFSKIINNIDVESLIEISDFRVVDNTKENVFKVQFKPLSTVKIHLYSLSEADNIISKLRRKQAIKGDLRVGLEDVNLSNVLVGNTEYLKNGVFQMNIDFRPGKEKANLYFLIDGSYNINDLSILESKKII